MCFLYFLIRIRSILLVLIFYLFYIPAVNSQSYCTEPTNAKGYKSNYNFSTVSIVQIGTGIGLTTLSGDRKHPNANGYAYYVNFDLRLTKGFFLGLRSQFGTLQMESGDAPLFDDRQLLSKFTALGGGILFYPFEYFEEEDNGRGDLSLKRYLLNALYFEVNAFNFTSNIKTIHRNVDDLNTYGPIAYYDDKGAPIFKDKLHSLILPSLNIGFSPMVHFRNMKNSSGKYILRFVANVQFNISNNDLLDGYDPINEVNKANDYYRFYSLGFKYSF